MQAPTTKLNLLKLLCLALTVGSTTVIGASNEELVSPPINVQAYSKQLRVDLVWSASNSPSSYEIQRADNSGGVFQTLSNAFPKLTTYSDFIGHAGSNYTYRVRSIKTDEQGQPLTSDWSGPVVGRPQPLDLEQLLTEVQEAHFRYFYDYGHPVSGLARISSTRDSDTIGIGANGMGLFNLVVGVERGFITRQEAVERILKQLQFLSEKADRFHGAFPHLLNGATGKTIPFSKFDDGADIVETAFLMEGIIFVREYFSGSDTGEVEIRRLANNLWQGVEWNWFVGEKDGKPALLWHWSPNYGWKMNHTISGFNECQIVYILALASPTHPVPPKVYWQGWETTNYGSARIQYGIPLELAHNIGPPLFWTHYSYLGLDPAKIYYHGKSYSEIFNDFCRVQIRYAESKSNVFKGYGQLWGITASRGPDGYKPFAPGTRDNGTLAPTAALSSIPYVPDESRSCLLEMYQKYGSQLWGPFGFYDAFNCSRDWVARGYLGIDEGPIAPMIENYRSGLCWKIFMKAPELKPVIKLLAESHAPHFAQTP